MFLYIIVNKPVNSTLHFNTFDASQKKKNYFKIIAPDSKILAAILQRYSRVKLRYANII